MCYLKSGNWITGGMMLKAKIYLNNELLTEMSDDGLDPLLYEVANWRDQTMYITDADKLVIEVTPVKGNNKL